MNTAEQKSMNDAYETRALNRKEREKVGVRKS